MDFPSLPPIPLTLVLANTRSNAENWQDAKLPTELSKVLLLEADTMAVLGNNDRVQISSARIGSQSLLRITSGSKLTIFNREVRRWHCALCEAGLSQAILV